MRKEITYILFQMILAYIAIMYCFWALSTIIGGGIICLFFIGLCGFYWYMYYKNESHTFVRFLFLTFYSITILFWIDQLVKYLLK